MNISGVIRLDGLSEIAVQTLSEFELRHPQAIRVTFGPLQDYAVVSWDSSRSLAAVSSLIRLFRAIGS
jgi:hypothetical protein